MYLTMKNYELNYFGEFIFELSLKGKASRMRSRFLTIIESQLELIGKEREILLKDYAKLDENDEIITNEDSEGKKFAVIADPVSYNLEISKLMNEDFIIEVKDDNREMIKAIQDAVLEVDKEFSGIEAEKYNRLCEVFESVDL